MKIFLWTGCVTCSQHGVSFSNVLICITDHETTASSVIDLTRIIYLAFYSHRNDLEISTIVLNLGKQNVSEFCYNLPSLMHLSLVCPRMGGPGNPRELDFVKRTWVGILTSTTVPGWEIWLDRHLEKWRGPGNEWVVRHLGKYPGVIWASFQRPSVLLFFQKICCFLCPSVLCL